MVRLGELLSDVPVGGGQALVRKSRGLWLSVVDPPAPEVSTEGEVGVVAAARLPLLP